MQIKEILSKLFRWPDPFAQPLKPKHRHALVVRDEMDREPIENPENWSPRKQVPAPLSRPYLWKGRPQ